MMKVFFIVIIILRAILISITYAQQYDSQSVNSQYNQYSPNDINNPYSQYEMQYSPKNINSPYSRYNQSSLDNINNSYRQHETQQLLKTASDPFVQKEQSYHADLVQSATQNKGIKAAKKSPKIDPAESFFNEKKSKRNIPLFLYLLVLSSLALGVTILIIIGIFKK
jgi:hypothetical protein